MSDVIQIERDGPVVVVRFNRPQRHNALNDEMCGAFEAAMEDVLADPGIRAIVLAGAGPSFSSGRDTAELGQREPGVSDFDFVSEWQDKSRRRIFATKPIVAAVHGWVLGGGLEIALSADMRVAGTDTRMGFPEITHGLITDCGGIPLAASLIGPARAKFLVLSGRPVDAAQALQWGLADWLVSPDVVEETAIEIAGQLCVGSPSAVAYAQKAFHRIYEAGIQGALNSELLGQLNLFAERREAAENAP